jgi:NADH-quinone oxidoreductase subunit A
VQFDLRYYVVALLFVIFDVEVAFFFPWATVFGKANQLSNLPPLVSKAAWEKLSDVEKADREKIEAKRNQLSEQLLPAGMADKTKIKFGLMKSNKPTEPPTAAPIPPDVAKGWAIIAFGDIFVFFGVLMVGFAYVWRRGDIDWVRSYAHHEEPPAELEKTLEQPTHMPAPAPVASHH